MNMVFYYEYINMTHMVFNFDKPLSMSSSRKIKLTNCDKWTTVDAEDYDRVNQFEWFGVYDERTKGIHAARTIEVEKGKYQLELMENFIMEGYPQSRKAKRKQTRQNNKKTVNK